MRAALLGLAIILHLAPLAVAGGACVGDVCAGDQNSGSGTCESGNGQESHKTGLFLGDHAAVSGGSECWAYDGDQSGQWSGVNAHVNAQDYQVGAAWATESHDTRHGSWESCYLYAVVVLVDCPAELGSPPNPGWGSLLP